MAIEHLKQRIANAESASLSWFDYGNIYVRGSYDETPEVTDDIAFQHVQLMADEYGSGFYILDGFAGHVEQCNLWMRRHVWRGIPGGEAAG